MKKILINYASKSFRESQKANTASAYKTGGFDTVVEYSPADIDRDFYRENKRILAQTNGAGLWLWKPYFLKKTLAEAQNGDIVFYCDSGCYFEQSALPLVSLPEKFEQDIIIFELQLIEKHFTKRDAFLLLDVDKPEFTDTKQRMGGFIVAKKSKSSVEFVAEYLRRCTDERLITDMDNTLGQPNYPGFVEHRHDQSILSLLSKKSGYRGFCDPTQWGDAFRHDYSGLDYGRIINLNRKRSFDLRWNAFRIWRKIKRHIIGYK